MVDLGLRLLLAYMLGSLMGALIVGRLSGAGDIREEGSGNAGGTNALRTRGLAFALGVIAIDIGKGSLAATWVANVPLGTSASLGTPIVAMLCGAAAVVGHVFPVWFNFRGGKGAATLVGAYLGLAAVVVIPVLLVWLLCLVLSGFVGLSTMVAAASAALAVWVLQPGPAPDALVVFALAMALLLVYTHRSNLARMLRGVEDRKHAIMLFARNSERNG
ncbi:MAG: glycerol-3-phosphate 1-O-acyltransferase PlsY [Pseudomonadota bacterium]